MKFFHVVRNWYVKSSRPTLFCGKALGKCWETSQENIHCRVLILVELKADCLEQLFYTIITPVWMFPSTFLTLLEQLHMIERKPFVEVKHWIPKWKQISLNGLHKFSFSSDKMNLLRIEFQRWFLLREASKHLHVQKGKH